ncbi:flavin reductase family protein [Bacillus salinus]|uniref:flavin reductase family protein n=1 Tax=Bacillus sp. HMF5848 TaxID=2495421 RepID=UPI0021AD6BA1|nr:flavin reductase family protein [Bacillus sp. HMF5848]
MLSSAVIPRPIALVTSESDEGIVNAAPFSFFNVLTSSPPLISISIGRRNGDIVKDTAKNILSKKEFVVHIIDETLVPQMNDTSYEYPSNISEVEQVGFTLIESKNIQVPAIGEAKVRLECILHESIPLGTAEQYNCDLIIGEVVMFHIDEDTHENGKVLAEKLNTVGRLGRAEYARMKDVFSLPRPIKKN